MEEAIEIWGFTDYPPSGETFWYRLEKRGTLLTIRSGDPGFEDRQTKYSGPKVLSLLEFFLRANGQVLTRDEIHDEFWKRAKDERTLDTYLTKLRKLLNDDSRSNRRGNVLNGRIIETLSGGGVRFAPKVLHTGGAKENFTQHPTEALPEPAGGTIALTAALIDYLKRLINECGELPRYYPDRLRCNLDLGHLWQDINVEMRSNDQHLGKPAPAQLIQNARRPGLMNSLMSSLPASNTTAEQAVSTWTTVRQDPRCRQVVILGDAGSGKSWLLRYEARRVAQASMSALQNGVALDTLPEIPVLQRLADLYEVVGQGQTLLDAVLENLKGEGASELLREMIATLFRAGRVALFLDGWDEVAAGVETPSGADARALLRRRIERFSKSYGGRILLSSRRVRYSSGLMPQAMELDVLPLKFAQIRRFLRSWFEIKGGDGRWSRRGLNGMHPDAWYPKFAADCLYSATRRDKTLAQLVKLPLMLALLCRSRERRSHRPEFTARPLNKAQVYEMLLNGLLFDWRADDKAINADQLERNLRLSQLSRAAWAAQLRPQLSKIELAQCLGFDPIADTSQARSTIANLEQTGILIEAGGGNKMFFHRSFQEYLTAAHIAVQPDAFEQIKQLARNSDWHDVVVLASSLVDRPFDLVIDLLADGPDSDLTPRNHSLAFSVWAEASLLNRGTARALGAWDMSATLRLLIFTDWASIGKIARIVVYSRGRINVPTLDEILNVLPGVHSSRPPDRMMSFLTGDYIETAISKNTEQLKNRLREIASTFGSKETIA